MTRISGTGSLMPRRVTEPRSSKRMSELPRLFPTTWRAISDTSTWPPLATSHRRAATFTGEPKTSPARSATSPMCRPMRTRSGSSIVGPGGGEDELAIDGGRHRRRGRVEHGQQAIARVLHHSTAVRLHGRGQQAIVLVEQLGHRLRLALPAIRTALDVRHEDAHRLGWGDHHADDRMPRPARSPRRPCEDPPGRGRCRRWSGPTNNSTS